MIATGRLLIRRPRLEDAADLAVAYGDTETVRYIGDGSTSTRKEVERGIERWLEAWEANGLGLCSLERREDGGVLEREVVMRSLPALVYALDIA
jgi:RimJ/RimL family protein N-acetyltransferase